MSTEEDREALVKAMVNVAVTDDGMVEFMDDPADRECAGHLADAILAAGFRRDPAPAPDAVPPVYLALDLWMALGMHSSAFDGYYDRNGWADTWANLLDAVRSQSGRKECPIIADGEGCVLLNGHIGPHTGASDVGSSEPLPTEGGEASTPQVTDAMVEAAYKAALENGAGQLWKADVRAALEAALGARE